MEEEVMIKQEPIDSYDTEEVQQVMGNGEFSKFMQYAQIDQNKVKNKGNAIQVFYTRNTPLTEVECSLPFVEERANKITVSASESIKTEDELRFIKEVMDEEDEVNAEYPNTEFYKCRRRSCEKTFRTVTQRENHENQVHGVARILKCNFCQRNFKDFFALTRHMSEHRNEKRYVCSYCTKCCSSYKDLQEHWRLSKNCVGVFAEKSQNNLSQPEISLLKSKPENKKITKPQNDRRRIQKLECESFINPQLQSIHLQSLHTQNKPLSFADEVKAFAARYQLKSSTVVKKRSSLITSDLDDPIKKQKAVEIESPITENIENNFSNPLLNLKIKEEPLDVCDDEQQISAQFDEVQVKSEPIDYDYEPQAEPICEIFVDKTFSQPTIPLETNSKMPIYTKIKNDNICKILSKNSMKCIESPQLNSISKITAIKSNHPISMKNIKILKLAKNAKIIKIPAGEKVKLEPISNNNSPEQKPTDPPFLPIKLQSLKSERTLLNTKLKNVVFEAKDGKSKQIVEKLESFISRGISGKRINSVPKGVLQFIEKQPHKLKIIQELQDKVKLAESLSSTITSISDTSSGIKSLPNVKIEKDSETFLKDFGTHAIPDTSDVLDQDPSSSSGSTNTSQTDSLDSPYSVFVKLSNDCNEKLKKVRRLNKNFRFSWICPYCPIQYEKKYAFQYHLISEHNLSREEFRNLTVEVRSYSVENCVKVLKPAAESIKTQFKKEIMDETSPNEFVTSYQCSKCGVSYSTRQMLNIHLRANCSRSPQYPCSKCNKSFYTAGTLKCHLTIHTGELPHKCNYCEKRFRTRGQVTVHHRTHTGEKPFTCQICTQSFTHRETFISHLSRHIGMKRYRCYGCNKHFACVSGLTTHRGVRPDTCGRVKLNTRAVGPRVRVVRGQVHFEPQPAINPYLRSEEPSEVLGEIQNLPNTNK